jgi:polyisoprenoid-binding protein YceI
MVTKVRGRFGAVEGTITVADVPENSAVEVSIDAASVDTRNEQRDGHLKSPDFLDVENYPTIGFKSTKLERSRDGFKLIGDLTVKDVTRPVTLEVEFDGAAADPWGGQRISFSAKGEINREDFGMTWNQAMEAGGVLVSKKAALELDVQAIRQDA